jgi:hypothetical protein
MVISSLAAPALSARWPRERLLVAGIAVVGLSLSPLPGCRPSSHGDAVGDRRFWLVPRTWCTVAPPGTDARPHAGPRVRHDRGRPGGAYFLGAVWIGLSGSSNAVRSYTLVGSAFLIIAAITFKLLGNVDRDPDTEHGVVPLLEVGEALRGEPT